MTPDQYTISETNLAVGDRHELYIQEWGSKKANTVFLFLHGGPGSGCNDSHKQLFNPLKNRVVFFDQRGAGKSTPFGSLVANTTQDLIADIEKIAKRLDLDSFVIVGGSWGSTLALAYALEQPARVQALVLRGIFTGSQSEIDYVEKGGFRAMYPEVWEAFLARTPAEHHDEPAAYHAQRLLSGKEDQAMRESALAFSELEGSLVRLDDRRTNQTIVDIEPFGTRIEIHYTSNLCFMPDTYILDNAHKLQMPVTLVQGRYDFVCPPVTAYKLHKLLPKSELIWTMAGHSGSERANYEVTKAIITAFE